MGSASAEYASVRADRHRSESEAQLGEKSELRGSEHARDVGGIRGKDDKIMYGELGELHGVRLDPTSKASCELYLRVRKTYYSNRDTYGCGYLNKALSMLIKIHDAILLVNRA